MKHRESYNKLKKMVAITIDVETDWGGRLRGGPGNCLGIEEGIPYLLSLLAELNVKATFFISGEVVKNNKDIICEISESWHEIASHSFKHNIDYGKLSKDELFNQINISKELIEDEIGIKPLGFRMPQFRINDHLFDVLSDLGFKYDSSMVRSIFPSRYSSLSIPSEPFFKNGILEIPISTIPYIMLPLGLLWINAMGFSTFRFLIKPIKLPDPIVLYLHPFDLIVNKSKNDFGFFVNRWYNYKTRSVKDTLISVLDYWKNKNKEFICLKDILSQNKSYMEQEGF